MHVAARTLILPAVMAALSLALACSSGQELDAPALAVAYENDPVAAEAGYGGEEVELDGLAIKTTFEADPSHMIALVGTGFRSVFCFGPAGYTKEQAFWFDWVPLEGRAVKVKGRVTGMENGESVYLRDCTAVQA